MFKVENAMTLEMRNDILKPRTMSYKLWIITGLKDFHCIQYLIVIKFYLRRTENLESSAI